MGWNSSTEDFRADHYRDMHDDPRPGDRLSPQIATALEVAIIVKNLANIRDAEKLIEQYGNTRAAEGRLDGATSVSDRIVAGLEAPLVRA